MDWQPTMSWKVAKQRASLLRDLRSFFDDKGIIEVDTPLLTNNTVTDVHLDAITATFDWSETGSIKQYLQTSPEYAMKRLLASGYQSIYQICKSFRNESQGRYHNPEFTMLEWYRIDYSMDELIQEVAELLKVVLNVDDSDVRSYQSAFMEATRIDPLEATQSQLTTFIEENNKLEPWLVDSESIDILLQFIFCEFVEPIIGQKQPCFIHSFPASQASLATINDNDIRVANRFECYFKGIELANGFNELTDVDLQLSRFNKDNDERLRQKLSMRKIDQNFISALTQGLPECSGVALGVDRLLMLLLDVGNIEQVICFPNSRA